jgi:AcrR family transcriptional regulator
MAKAAQTRRERQKADIRAELVAAAHGLVKEEGYEGLTIRKLAQRVGYAPMSVYSYFPDKHAILFALAQDAFEILARRMRARTSDDPREALCAVMHEYVDFALENPDEYRIVFMTRDPALPEGADPVEHSRGNPAMRILVERVEACVAAGVFQGDIHAISTLLWTFGHGAVALLISFPRYPFGDRDVYIARLIEVTLAGLQAAPVAPLGDVRNC